MAKNVLIISGSPRKGGNFGEIRNTPACEEAYRMGKQV